MGLLRQINHYRERLLVALCFLLLSLSGLSLTDHPVLQRLGWLAYDQLLLQTDREPTPDPRIVIVDIDDTSLARQGRWPWPRSTLATLLRSIQAAEPAVIAVDILFPEADTPSEDRLLQQALAHPALVTAIAFGPIDQSSGPWPRADRMLGLSPALNSPNTQTGHITPLLDADGSIRRLPPLICHLAECHPALSVAAVSLLLQQPLSYSPASGLRPARLCVGSLCQPVSEYGEQLIPYSGTHFNYIPATDILSGKIGAEQLAGRIVLLGTSAAGLGDLVSTPLNPLTPGVEIHARLIAAWLDRQSFLPLPHAGAISTLLCAGLILTTLALILSQAGWLRRPFLLLALLLPSLPLFLALADIWLNPVPLALTAALALSTELGTLIHRQRRQRQRMQQAFSAYVPPIVVDQLIEQGHSLQQLDAQRADVSIMFADIQGFTRMTEQLAPERLVALTQWLFTEITTVIQAHGGTLDKFIGDAVMAFWGAPLQDPQHSHRAVQCALAIQRRISELQPELSARGYPPIQFKIGLEAGSVTAGNLGAEQRRAYTVMGEAVNAAARIEEAAGQTQVGILLGPEISQRVADSIPLNEVACLRLSGISKPMLLHTPKAALNTGSPD